MTPIPAGHEWALSATGSRRHIKAEGHALCMFDMQLRNPHLDVVMSRDACKRCLSMTGGQQ